MLASALPLYAAYAGAACCVSAINNVFVTYYIHLFAPSGGALQTHSHALQYEQFMLAQSMYMVWNAVNDPLFGWLSDHVGRSVTARRSVSIGVGGLLLSLACYAVLSHSLTHALVHSDSVSSASPSLLPAIHFGVALCAYDGALTFVELNLAALLAEVTQSAAGLSTAVACAGVSPRVMLVVASAAGAAVGSLSSAAAFNAWSDAYPAAATASSVQQQQQPEVFDAFVARLCLTVGVAVAICSVALYRYERAHTLSSAAHAHVKEEIVAPSDDAATAGTAALRLRAPAGAASPTAATVPSAPQPGSISFISFVRQLVYRPSFLVYILVSCLQVFDCTFEKNFFLPFMHLLTRGAASGTVLSLSFLLPHVMTVVWTPLLTRLGLHATLAGIFALRLVALALAALVGHSDATHVLQFMLINRVLSESVCRLTPLIVSDMVDEDAAIGRRPRQLSASVIGTASFASKLFQSLAPMLAYHALHIDAAAQDVPGAGYVWFLLLIVPATCVSIQIIVWMAAWPLKGAYLKNVRETLRSMEEEERTGKPDDASA